MAIYKKIIMIDTNVMKGDVFRPNEKGVGSDSPCAWSFQGAMGIVIPDTIYK